MNTSNNNHINIQDFPNEILFTIFNKLNMVDVLYSLADVNERVNRLVLNPLYIRDLDMTIMIMKSFSDRIFSIDNQVLDRICEKILPRIHHQVHRLTIESRTIERLLTVDYPQLYSLTLIDFEDEILQYLAGNSILQNLLTNQITHVDIDIRKKKRTQSFRAASTIFTLVLILCKRLINLNFCQLYSDRSVPICIYYLPATGCRSSTLTTLKIAVENFDDCLHLLDGRLDCLSTLIISVEKIPFTLSNAENMKKLPKLKCFSLSSYFYTLHYDNRIIPLLRRMINLEELKLFLSVARLDSTYIDGTHLYNDILIYMPRLNKFSFSIHTYVHNESVRNGLSSNEDIQRSFMGKRYGQVGSYIRTVSKKVESLCHVYSLPYEFENFIRLNNSFQGGMFHKVQYLMMSDTRSFEHTMFRLISQDFPFLKCLSICNSKPQRKKQYASILITFPHLMLLKLETAHVDYAEQFLLEKNTYLPRLMNLNIGFESLAMVTNNFTNDAARINCAKLKRLNIDEPFVRPENFHQFFPLL